jgi:protein SCO1/2
MRRVLSVDVPARGRVRFEPCGPRQMTTSDKHKKVLFIAPVVAGLIAGAVLGLRWLRPSEFRLDVLPPGSASSDFHLIDFDGHPRSLADYRGQVVVIFFGYVHCPDACPAELFKLAQVMKRLGPASAHVQVLLITLDPQRDTLPILKGYVTYFDPRFVGLSGTEAQIDEAAASFYVAHANVPVDGDYSAIDHSTATYVLDALGRRRLIGSMSTSIDDFAHDIERLTH